MSTGALASIRPETGSAKVSLCVHTLCSYSMVRPVLCSLCTSQRQHECHQVFFLLGSQLGAENQIEELDSVVQGH